MSSKIDYIFTAALDDPFKRHAAPQQPTKTTENGMIIERHVAIPLRSKRHAFADVWRPEDESSKAAPLIAWTPYGKHNPTPIHKIYPNSGVDPSWISDSTGFEQPDPQYWTRHGYAVVVVDVPGLWLGAGRATFSSGAEEAEFFADAIAWAAARPWSGGRVGLSGVSYLAVSQWHVAALRPPGLAAVVPVEGWSDFYREVVRHGGVPCDSFFPYIARRWAVSVNETENLIEEAEAHPLFDELWESKKAKLERIEVPALVVASFADQGLHTRGTLEGFKRIGSKEKWLICHRRRKWAFYYTPEVVEKQRAFYDKFLKGRDDTQVEQWPRVLLEIGDRYYDGTWRAEVEWPLVSKQVLTPLYLNVANESLLKDAPKETSVARYHGLGSGPGATRAAFKIQFPEAVEMTGHIAARLFMKAESDDDMDVFVAIYKLDAQDNLVGQCTYAQ
ncbi:putative hydrolase family protein [Neofusicoccum parvum]|nr:putative hydrolase family protein [Neofusicoccum parvum]